MGVSFDWSRSEGRERRGLARKDFVRSVDATHGSSGNAVLVKDENKTLSAQLAASSPVSDADPAGSSASKKMIVGEDSKGKEVELPTGVWAKIAEKLHRNDVFAFAMTCKQLREAQQAAGRELKTKTEWETMDDGACLDDEFTRSWCWWHTRSFNIDDTRTEYIKAVNTVAASRGFLDVLKHWENVPADKKELLWEAEARNWAADRGHLEVVKFLRSQGCSWDTYTCAWAAGGGQLDIVKFLRSQGCPWDAYTCTTAARKARLEVLKWARSEGCPWDANTCTYAAIGGHLEILKWARSQGCPWDIETCACAAHRGHLEVLKWIRGEGCPWNWKTCACAALGGHFEVLQWARRQGAPWNEGTCAAAALGGHIEVLKWARSEGCPWNEWTCLNAAAGGHLEVLKWARRQGAPLDTSDCMATAAAQGHPHVAEWCNVLSNLERFNIPLDIFKPGFF